jgi:hypothetical protein
MPTDRPDAWLFFLGFDTVLVMGFLYLYDRRRFRWAGISVASVIGIGILFAIYVNVLKPALGGNLKLTDMLSVAGLPAIIFGYLVGKLLGGRKR